MPNNKFVSMKTEINAAKLPKRRLYQCFSTFMRPQPGKFFFRKTGARSQ